MLTKQEADKASPSKLYLLDVVGGVLDGENPHSGFGRYVNCARKEDNKKYRLFNNAKLTNKGNVVVLKQHGIKAGSEILAGYGRAYWNRIAKQSDESESDSSDSETDSDTERIETNSRPERARGKTQQQYRDEENQRLAHRKPPTNIRTGQGIKTDREYS
jgi:hypothetical protein